MPEPHESGLFTENKQNRGKKHAWFLQKGRLVCPKTLFGSRKNVITFSMKAKNVFEENVFTLRSEYIYSSR